ncbi:MAG: TraR/DksA family transcriptional regulator [Rudaea sp.]
MGKSVGPEGKSVLRKVRAAAHSAKKRVKVSRVAPRPPSELRLTPDALTLVELKRERERLLGEIQQQEVLTQDHPTNGNHMADDASEVFEQTKNLALKRHLEAMLEQVESAVRRIERGTYGTCEKCGLPIDPERLKVLPEATLCVDCARGSPRGARPLPHTV